MAKSIGIILMAGLSTRFGEEKNKQLCLLNGKPLFSYSIDAFNKTNEISELFIVVNKINTVEIENFLNKNKIKANIVLGGATRQESVENALRSAKLDEDDIVVIHDGARPLVDTNTIVKVAEAAKNYGASSTFVEAVDTIAKRNVENEVESFIDRSTVAIIQTPQAFKYNEIQKAHSNAKNNAATDDCSLVLACGGHVKLVEGSKLLHKVTTKDDIKYLEGFLK